MEFVAILSYGKVKSDGKLELEFTVSQCEKQQFIGQKIRAEIKPETIEWPEGWPA